MKHAILKNKEKNKHKPTIIKLFSRVLSFFSGGNTWYRKTMFNFFLLVVFNAILLELPVFGLRNKSQNFENFLEIKKARHKAAESFWQSILYSNYYYTPVYLTGIVDFIVLVFFIKVILTKEETLQVATLQMEMSRIVRSVPKQTLEAKGNPFREQLILRNTILNKILGNKHFRLKITRLEFLKEVLTLNYALILVLFLSKRVIDIMFGHHAKVQAVVMTLEACVAAFMHFKTIVYVGHRLKDRPEYSIRRLLALFIYGIFFLSKLSLLFSVWHSMNEYQLFVMVTFVSYVVYRVADRINDFGAINNIRIFLYFVALDSK